MGRGIENAVAALKEHPERTVTAEIDGLVIELRFRGQRTADDLFREVGLWEGESYEELRERIDQGRRDGGSKEPPKL